MPVRTMSCPSSLHETHMERILPWPQMPLPPTFSSLQALQTDRTRPCPHTPLPPCPHVLQSLQTDRTRPWAQTPLPPQSLHTDLTRPWSQIPEPPQSRQRLGCLRCAHSHRFPSEIRQRTGAGSPLVARRPTIVNSFPTSQQLARLEGAGGGTNAVPPSALTACRLPAGESVAAAKGAQSFCANVCCRCVVLDGTALWLDGPLVVEGTDTCMGLHKAASSRSGVTAPSVLSLQRGALPLTTPAGVMALGHMEIARRSKSAR